jgi:transcriptional regulator with XRE-family HTH domain
MKLERLDGSSDAPATKRPRTRAVERRTSSSDRVTAAAPTHRDLRHQSVALGRLIRQARQDKFSLEQLALRAGVSTGLISQVERGNGNPSFLNLLRIARALDLPLGALLQGPNLEGRMLVRKSQRRRLSLPHEGITYELLTPGLHGQLAVVRTLVPIGFNNREAPFRHAGEECLYVESGTLDVFVGEFHARLEVGDAITYDSSIPHWFENLSSKQVVLMGAVTPPDF